MKGILFCFLWILIVFTSSAQVVLLPVQKDPMSLASQDLWSLSIVNNDKEMTDVYIRVTVSENNKGSILEGRSAPFFLQKGNLNSASLQSIISPVKYNYIIKEYNRIIFNNKMFPSGEYEICWTLMNLNGEPINEVCILKYIELISPPHLILPENNATVSEFRPFFTWSPPVPIREFNKLSYSFFLTEISEDDNPYRRIWQMPMLFSKNDIISPVLHYPFEAPTLEIDKKYVWTIVADYDGEKIPAEEVWVFEFDKKPEPVTIIGNSYWIISENLDGSFDNVNDTLRISYKNITEDTFLKYSILNPEDISRNISVFPTIPIKPGHNNIDIPIHKIKGLKKGNKYILIIYGKSNKKYQMTFLYNK